MTSPTSSYKPNTQGVDNTASRDAADGGLLNGPGKIIYPAAAVFEGEYRDGKIHGHGRFTTNNADGRRFVGNFKDGNPIGHGGITSADGRISTIAEKTVNEPKSST
jgi:hypothetical protein